MATIPSSKRGVREDIIDDHEHHNATFENTLTEKLLDAVLADRINHAPVQTVQNVQPQVDTGKYMLIRYSLKIH